ncbi:MAG: FemAB family PEP-CTERM system-associated protein [Woeseiaceae bacterium]|nr:FemAB family PEP-CTERM system-associated protein [Woeseiaceae bacterium]
MNDTSAPTGQAYRVRELTSADEDRWDAFVESSPAGTFFHLSGWQHIVRDSLGHPTWYLYCERDGDILGVLPLAQVKSFLFGNALISLPFLVYGGVVSSDPEAEALLIEAACEKARELRVDHLELRNRKPSGRDWATKSQYVSFSKAIDPDPEKNLMAIPRKQRAMVRKGIKAGLVAERDEDARRLYDALLPCKRNLGTPFFNRRYLQSIVDEFGERVEITTITRNGDTVCSVMSFRFRNEVLPYYGGGGDAARIYKGNDFMYWAVMEQACKDGVEIFDYGRSMVDTGAYRFKKHWGFEPRPLSYEFFLVESETLPNLNPSNPRYQRLISIWKKLPLAVADLIGPPVARRLG